jgi:hypothetical protein
MLIVVQRLPMSRGTVCLPSLLTDLLLVQKSRRCQLILSCKIRKPFGLQDPLPQTHRHGMPSFPLTLRHILALFLLAFSDSSYNQSYLYFFAINDV